jgi:hypothetical protein
LDADHFIRLAEGLTGTPVKDLTATDGVADAGHPGKIVVAIDYLR